jgi:hypothetical protein
LGTGAEGFVFGDEIVGVPAVRVDAFGAEGAWLDEESADVEGSEFSGDVFGEC